MSTAAIAKAKGDALMRATQFRDAVEVYAPLALSPADAADAAEAAVRRGVLSNLGLAYLMLEEFDSSVATYSKLLDVDPDNAKVRETSLCKEVLSSPLAPPLSQALYRRGLAHAKGDAEAARADLNAALALSRSKGLTVDCVQINTALQSLPASLVAPPSPPPPPSPSGGDDDTAHDAGPADGMTSTQRLYEEAEVLRAQKKHEPAERLFRRILELDERHYGPEHREVSSDLNSLAGELYAQGKCAAAEPYYRRALMIDERTLGPLHPQVAMDLTNLAAVLNEKSELKEAEKLFRRALKIDVKAYGPKDAQLVPDLLGLGACLFRQRLLTKAKQVVDHAALICKALPEAHAHRKAADNWTNILAKQAEQRDAVIVARRKSKEAAPAE